MIALQAPVPVRCDEGAGTQASGRRIRAVVFVLQLRGDDVWHAPWTLRAVSGFLTRLAGAASRDYLEYEAPELVVGFLCVPLSFWFGTWVEGDHEWQQIQWGTWRCNLASLVVLASCSALAAHTPWVRATDKLPPLPRRNCTRTRAQAHSGCGGWWGRYHQQARAILRYLSGSVFATFLMVARSPISVSSMLVCSLP